MLELLGYIDRISYYNAESGFTVARFQERGQSQLITLVGAFTELQPGETIRIWGDWVRDAKFGKQFKVEKYQIELPTDASGIKKYLSSGCIKGIGPLYAEKIVDCFGVDTLEVIEHTPEKLSAVAGMGKKRILAIQNGFKEQKSLQNIMLFLQSHAITPTYAHKIYKRYGADCLRLVQKNPYRLASEIHGIGFKLADKIAKALAIPLESHDRLDAGISFTLSELAQEGHVCYPSTEFYTLASERLEVPSSLIQNQIAHLIQSSNICMEDLEASPFIWAAPFFYAEKSIVKEIQRLQNSPTAIRAVHIANALKWIEENLTLKLAKNQKTAIEVSLQEKLHIITGGPGTGKSTITKAILRVSEKLTNHILLAAPTGRAAKRMSEITHRFASTIHSLLEFDVVSGKFKKGSDNRLKCDLIIIDEASMIDTYLLSSLLKAIPDKARVILIGDVDQLPSVGAGNTLKDLIDSQTIPTSRLTFIFRQSKNSKIAYNAHLINKGYFPDLKSDKDSDFFFIEEKEPPKVLQTILDLVVKRLPQTYGFDPVRDIQVLSPMKKGLIGIENLNNQLQKALNLQTIKIMCGSQIFARGDKVMQIKNNHEKKLSNGDIGMVITLDQIDKQLYVDFDNKTVAYDFAQLDELVLAYAASIHKYQGSEAKCVIIPIHTQHFKLLNRNLLYTGVTRAKKLVVLVGTKKALAIAIKNDEVQKRYTGLKQFLQNA